MTQYELSRNWFDWCFENTDLIKPSHTALYFFAIEHCNRLGWKDKFGLPTQMAMDAIGIKNWRTYSATFDDLVSWGFIEILERSKNQYSATVIAIAKNTKANTKALTKATQKHLQKQCKSIVVINKPNNKETNKPNNKEQQSLYDENLATEILTYFGFDKTNPLHHHQSVLANKFTADIAEHKEYFKIQFEGYKKYKASAKEKRHNLSSFLYKDNDPIKGGWNEAIWNDKLKKQEDDKKEPSPFASW